MARPTKYRRVECFPEDTYFLPRGKGNCHLQEVLLKVEELEAMRLKDIEKLNQEECAEKMQVSRQTFQNIIESGRRKVTDALINGKAINISGGNYIHKHCKWHCNSCNEDYSINVSQDRFNCPNCGSTQVNCHKEGKICKKWCRERIN